MAVALGFAQANLPTGHGHFSWHREEKGVRERERVAGDEMEDPLGK